MCCCVGVLSSSLDSYPSRAAARVDTHWSAFVGSEVNHGMRGLKQQHALITRTGRTTTTNMRRTMFCFSRRVSIWPAAPLGSSVMLWTSLSELFPRAMDALRVVSFTRAATLATAALARAAVLLLTSNGVVSTGGVVTAVAVAASEWAEAETSAGNIGWPLSLLRLDEWSVMAESKKNACPKMAIFVACWLRYLSNQTPWGRASDGRPQ